MFRKNFFKVLTAVLFVVSFAFPALGAMNDYEFFNLCASGSAQQVADAIKAGANVKAKGENNYTTLMVTVMRNPKPEIIKLLLNAGADVNVKNNGGGTVLMSAATNPNPEVMKILLNAGADVNAKNNVGITALMWAAGWNKNSEAIKMLLNAGADVNTKSNDGYTALMLAANHNQSYEVIKTLLNSGVDFNTKDNKGKTALDYARERNNTDVVKILETAALIPQVKKSAERGDANAQYQLGMMYATGDGVPEDQWEAVKWLKKAAKQGHRDARNELAKRGIYE